MKEKFAAVVSVS